MYINVYIPAYLTDAAYTVVSGTDRCLRIRAKHWKQFKNKLLFFAGVGGVGVEDFP